MRRAQISTHAGGHRLAPTDTEKAAGRKGAGAHEWKGRRDGPSGGFSLPSNRMGDALQSEVSSRRRSRSVPRAGRLRTQLCPALMGAVKAAESRPVLDGVGLGSSDFVGSCVSSLF